MALRDNGRNNSNPVSPMGGGGEAPTPTQAQWGTIEGNIQTQSDLMELFANEQKAIDENSENILLIKQELEKLGKTVLEISSTPYTLTDEEFAQMESNPDSIVILYMNTIYRYSIFSVNAYRYATAYGNIITQIYITQSNKTARLQGTSVQTVDNKVEEWSDEPTDTNYPSEKLVKDSLDILEESKEDKSLIIIIASTPYTLTEDELASMQENPDGVVIEYGGRNRHYRFFDDDDSTYYYTSNSLSNGYVIRVDKTTGVVETGQLSMETTSRKVSSWSDTPTTTNYPSEKLVKDSLDAKQDLLTAGEGISINKVGNETVISATGETEQLHIIELLDAEGTLSDTDYGYISNEMFRCIVVVGALNMIFLPDKLASSPTEYVFYNNEGFVTKELRVAQDKQYYITDVSIDAPSNDKPMVRFNGNWFYNATAGNTVPSGQYVGQVHILTEDADQGRVKRGIYVYNGQLWVHQIYFDGSEIVKFENIQGEVRDNNALATEFDKYQTATDERLTTDDDRIFGAINEVNENNNTTQGFVDSILDKIPEEATADNQLADKLYVGTLVGEAGARIDLEMNSTNYKIVAKLYDANDELISTSTEIDLPLESVVVGGSYDATNKKIILTLNNGTTIDIPVADLVSGLASTTFVNEEIIKVKDWADAKFALGTEIPTKVSELQNDAGYITFAEAPRYDDTTIKAEINALDGRVDTAENEIVALQNITDSMTDDIQGLDTRVTTIEGKEAGWDAKYSKPESGIPKSDLASDVKTSLGKADISASVDLVEEEIEKVETKVEEQYTKIEDTEALETRVSTIEGKEIVWNNKYSKPYDGIPKSDLVSAVQTSLDKADTSLQQGDKVEFILEYADGTTETLSMISE